MGFAKFFSSSPSSTAAATSTQVPLPEIEVVQQRIRQALWGFFAGDALSAPTHWFYGGQRQIRMYYGDALLTDYTKPSHELGGSILNKSNLFGAGRSRGAVAGGGERAIVGDVILHGKRDLWHPSKQIHYHATLQAGENTLEASLGRVLMKSIVANKGKFDADHFRQAYMEFMQEPGSHNDTYASTCHRMFFANLVFRQKAPEDCPDNDSHNVDTIDGLILPTLVSLAAASQADASTVDVAEQAQACVSVTRRSKPLQKAVAAWSGLVYTVLRRKGNDEESLTDRVNAMARSLHFSTPRVKAPVSTMTACYLDSSLPAALDNLVTFDAQWREKGSVEDVWRSLLAVANIGGENVHRASCLGAILGASSEVQGGQDDWENSRLVQGLYHHEQLKEEIEDFVRAVTLSE